MIYIVNLNELSLVSFLWLMLLRRDVYVLSFETFLPQSAGPLRRLAERAVAKGLARWAVELCPELAAEWEYSPRVLLHEVFASTESWQNTYYRFDVVSRAVPDYALAYKHVTCSHTWSKHVPLVTLLAILDSAHAQSLKVLGVAADTEAMLLAYGGTRLSFRSQSTSVPRRLINAAISLLAVLYGWAFIVRRTQLSRVSPQPFFLVADYMDDVRDIRLYQELEEGGPIALVERWARPDCEERAEIQRYPSYKATDGAFSPAEAFLAAGHIVIDCLRLFRHLGSLEPSHYYWVAALPYRRIVLRAFFNRFRPRYFWGRDPYNVEHILRRQELHRVGGESFGINVGYPVYSILYPMFRYVSFDRYYVYGRDIYDKYYRDTWPRDMTLVPVGSYSFTREQMRERFRPRPADIVVFSAIFITEPGMVALVRGLAEAFPDRRVLLQVKWNYADAESGKSYVAACCEGHSNVIPVRGPVYDLLFKARYAFSDPSTIVVEAIQAGVYSFAAEVSKIQRTSVFRDYPGLSVTSAEMAIQRIRAIESKSWTYPFTDYSGLVDLSGRIYLDAVRADVGLTPKEKPVPLVDEEFQTVITR